MGWFPQVRAADVAVSVGTAFFDPKNVTINVNDRVVWTWVGGTHSTSHAASPRLWDSGVHSTPGFQFSHVFSTVGTFHYYCTLHIREGQTGSVTVQAQGSNTPPSVTITNPVNDAVFIAPATFTVDASASDPDGTVSQVQFFLDTTSLGVDTISLYSAEVTNLAAGTYAISAVATDNLGAKATNSITLIVNAQPIDPTFSDANWSPLGSGLGGTYHDVYALAVSGNDLYAGGTFSTAGGSPAAKIAKWNGTNWSALGSGVFLPFDYKAIAAVNALAVSGGDLYAGGMFKTAGGSPATNIAKWNGSTWSALGSGMSGLTYPVVTALAVSGSDLYAGGNFSTAGGSPATNIAKWDGNSWSALGSGMNSTVYALAVSGSDLYAGGYFTTAGGSPANYIARWNGSSWSALGSGMSGQDYGFVYALAVSGTDLYAGGWFTTAGGTTANYIAKWNGSSWSPLGSGMNGPVSALAVSGSDLYAGGSFTTAGGTPANRIAKWDGNSWSPLGSGLGAGVLALAVSGTDLYAGGWFTTAGGTPANYIAKARIASAGESITASGSSATSQFSGVVGYQYHVQRTDSLTPPTTWTTLTASPVSPAADGSLTFTDTNAPPRAAYYRLVQH